MTTTDHTDAPDAADAPVSMDTLVSLCKRRGFVFPASEIYGGFGSTYDYGPLGVELKRNIKDAWWRSMVRERSDIVGIDTAIIQSPRVWEASGHVQNFSDPMVDCRECKGRFRADHLEGPTCPTCGATGSFTEAREFNLMFRTHVGPVEDAAATAYLRPETAQGIFINFENVLGSTRRRLPFGIAQQGKSFRNEITPGNFIFRTREFEQMEMEFFVDPAESNEWYERWIDLREAWHHDLGIRPENLRRDVHSPESLSHYSAGTTDLQYRFPWGWDELEGIANRTDFDLTQHGESSGKRLDYFDQAADRHVIPHVIEPAVGVDRIMLALLCDAYRVIPDEKGDARVVLALEPRMAPVTVAVLPLSRKQPVADLAREVWDQLRPHWTTQYDDTQSIGRRYRRQDEIGTPWCVTVDFESLDDNAATIRHRDTQKQDRLPIPELANELRARLGF